MKDQSDAAADATPVVAERMWERQAEDNAVERLQKIGLLAPPGEVDKVLLTVVNNLLVTNNIDLQADIRCRVLLTSPLESFTIGHTIVISRGLLDVLPDEASLAMVLAHELSHIVLGHHFDTKLAFNDRLFFPDEDSFQRLDFKRSSADEEAADTKASGTAEEFSLQRQAGNCWIVPEGVAAEVPRAAESDSPAPGKQLCGQQEHSHVGAAGLRPATRCQAHRSDRGAAARWPHQARSLDAIRWNWPRPSRSPLISAREKMPFEITPFFPYLTRFSTAGSEKVALYTAPAPK